MQSHHTLAYLHTDTHHRQSLDCGALQTRQKHPSCNHFEVMWRTNSTCDIIVILSRALKHANVYSLGISHIRVHEKFRKGTECGTTAQEAKKHFLNQRWFSYHIWRVCHWRRDTQHSAGTPPKTYVLVLLYFTDIFSNKIQISGCRSFGENFPHHILFRTS